MFKKRPRHVSAATIVSLTTLALILVRATTTADPYWDTLAYHWPYAARAAGLCDRACFLMPAGIEARYDGFPLLWHALQGILWRVTGTPALADVLNIAMVIALCFYLKLRFAVPFVWSWLGLIAIPVVQIEITSSYIDLPLNVGIALGLLVLLRIALEPTKDQRSDIAIALAALAVAAGSKHQMVPIALLVWGIIVVLCVWKPIVIRFQNRTAVLLVLSVMGAFALLPKVVLNAIEFHNPFYPIAFSLGPLSFPGPEEMMQSVSISDAWVRTPAPIRWLASVLEFDAFRGRPLPWTLGQADVVQANPSFRMGGYFVGYVLALVAIVALACRATRASRLPVVMLVAISIICSLLPLSHELRYYMFWMLTLVSLTLVLAHSPIFASIEQPTLQRFAHAAIAISFLTIVFMTGGAYMSLRGPKLPDLLKGTSAIVDGIPEGATVCILEKDRRAILYSSLFHPLRHYRTHLLENVEEDPACTMRIRLN